MDTYDKRAQQIYDRIRAARYSLWSGMLTAHTVLLSVAVALLPGAVKTVAWRFKSVGFIAILCMFLVLLCFLLTKVQYEAIGQRLSDPEQELTVSSQKHDIRWANIRFNLIKTFEAGSALGLLSAAVLLGWVLTTP